MVELIAPIVNFAVVLAILVKFGKKPFLDLFSTRAATIRTTIAEAEAQSSGALALLSEWEGKWKAAKAHAQQLLDDTKASLARSREQGLTAAKAESERIQREAKMVGETEVLRAKEKLGRELAENAVAAAGSYLGSNTDEKDRHQLVADYLEKVSDGTAR